MGIHYNITCEIYIDIPNEKVQECKSFIIENACGWILDGDFERGFALEFTGKQDYVENNLMNLTRLLKYLTDNECKYDFCGLSFDDDI